MPRFATGFASTVCPAEAMNPRGRRLILITSIAAVLLFAGRDLVGFLADRWWAASVSPEVAATSSHLWWMRLLLQFGSGLIGAAWLGMHAVIVARSIATVQVQHQVGGVAVRELVPQRSLVLSSGGMGAFFGGVIGWSVAIRRDAAALAWHGVHYGVTDPVLGVDLGVYVAQLPAWEQALQFTAVLIGLALVVVGLSYWTIGAFAREGRRVTIHPYARRHIGSLMASVGLVLGWGYLLAPYHLAIDQARWLSPPALETRIVAAHVVVGVAIAVSALTLRWAFVGRHTLVLASWGVMLATVVVERFLVPAFVAGEVVTASHTGYARDLADRLYGIVRVTPVGGGGTRSGPGIPDRWDREALIRQSRRRGEHPLLVVPGPAHSAAWLVVGQPSDTAGTLTVSRFVADSVSPDGAAVPGAPPEAFPGVTILPMAEGWSRAPAGVRAGHVLRRAALAWARQAPGMLALDDSATVDWHLDPVERVTSIMPTVEWRLTGFTVHGSQPTWVLNGFAVVRGVPHGTRSRFGGQAVDGVAPAIVAAIGARSGTVEAWLDPAADSLGRALGSLHRPFVRLDEPPPGEVLDALGYSVGWFDAQLVALQSATGDRLLADEGVPMGADALVSAEGPAVQVLLERPEPDGGVTMLTGVRHAHLPRVEVVRLDPALPTALGSVSAAWRSSAGFTQVDDSLRASGDTLIAGPLRWAVEDGHLTVWRSYGSLGRRGPARLLWTGVASSLGIDGGRPGAVRWGGEHPTEGLLETTPEFEEFGRLESARSWLMRADSALVRGDLTAFGRAWEALRGILRDTTRE